MKTVDEKKEAFFKHVNNMSSKWIEVADRKSAIILSISSALFAITPVVIKDAGDICSNLIVASLLVNSIAVTMSVTAIRPRLDRLRLAVNKWKSNSKDTVLNKSPTYFGDIASISKNEYKELVDSVFKSEKEPIDYFEQAYINSTIASKKMTLVSVGSYFYLLAILLFGLALFISYIDPI